MKHLIFFTLLVVSYPSFSWAGQGWYLIFPAPREENSTPTMANRDDWSQMGSYDSAKECQEDHAKMLKELERKIQDNTIEKGTKEKWKRIYDISFAGRCISTDDPRLK